MVYYRSFERIVKGRNIKNMLEPVDAVKSAFMVAIKQRLGLFDEVSDR
jgi:hypothetical protein